MKKPAPSQWRKLLTSSEAKPAVPIANQPAPPPAETGKQVIEEASPPEKTEIKELTPTPPPGPPPKAGAKQPPPKLPAPKLPAPKLPAPLLPQTPKVHASSSSDGPASGSKAAGVGTLSQSVPVKAMPTRDAPQGSEPPLTRWKTGQERTVKVIPGKDLPGVNRYRGTLPAHLFQVSKKFSGLLRGFEQKHSSRHRVPPMDGNLFINFDEAISYIRGRYHRSLDSETAQWRFWHPLTDFSSGSKKAARGNSLPGSSHFDPWLFVPFRGMMLTSLRMGHPPRRSSASSRWTSSIRRKSTRLEQGLEFRTICSSTRTRSTPRSYFIIQQRQIWRIV